MNQTTLFRYNFRVMMLNNWLLLAFPIAVSQLTVFWLVLTVRFSLSLPARCVEMVTPLLAAFLGAHLLSSEYRSRVGAILASRPVNIGRIVFMRLFVMLALVWSLALLSLLAFRVMMKPYDILLPFLACIPSTLFLTMVALTFATLFRNSLTGFAFAAAYWALDLVPGAPIQPYLSLKSLSSMYGVMVDPGHQTFLNEWWISKVILLIGALLLYLYHDRQVLSIGSPLTIRVRKRAAVIAVFIVGIYILSGAILKVTYGIRHRGELPQGDMAWFRYQMAPFGPIPVASIWGPSFRAFVGDIGNPWRIAAADEGDRLGDTEEHRRQLHGILDKDPHSMWAESAADGLAILETRGMNAEQATLYYRKIIDQYPGSPYLQNLLRDIARANAEANRLPEARAAYEELLQKVPMSRHRSEAYRFLFESERDANHAAQALQWAARWSAVAPIHEKFEALMDVAVLRQAAGDAVGAKQAVQQMMEAVTAFRKAVESDSITLSPKQTNSAALLAGKAELMARKMK